MDGPETSGSDSTGCDGEDPCVEAVCGNEEVEQGEACDDGNDVGSDGCEADCTLTTVTLDVSYQSTCALIGGTRVRCWGKNVQGQLGYGFTGNLGDEPGEEPSNLEDVPLPADREILQLHSGDDHTCALLGPELVGGDPGLVCWGLGDAGRLGYGNVPLLAEQTIGDDEYPAGLPDVDIGFSGGVAKLGVGGSHSCVLTEGGQIWCWGVGALGQLGYGDEVDIGTAANPLAPGAVQVGAAINDLATGIFQSCALLANDRIRCWGSGSFGQLGYGSTENVGDDETPSTMPGILFTDGGRTEEPVDVVSGWTFSCALFESGAVRCWGSNAGGELGWGYQDPTNTSFGDEPDEDISTLPPISLLPGDSRDKVVAIAAGDNHACALTDGGELRCWGSGYAGQLGQGDAQPIGDDEVPSDVPAIDFGGAAVVQFDAGGSHTCAVLEDGRVFCFGANFLGQLGLGHTDSIGDDEDVLSAGEVSLF